MSTLTLLRGFFLMSWQLSTCRSLTTCLMKTWGLQCLTSMTYFSTCVMRVKHSRSSGRWWPQDCWSRWSWWFAAPLVRDFDHGLIVRDPEVDYVKLDINVVVDVFDDELFDVHILLNLDDDALLLFMMMGTCHANWHWCSTWRGSCCLHLDDDWSICCRWASLR